MLSEGVRMVSECVRQMSEVCRCHINWKKFDYCHTNYMRPLLPVPIFVQKRPHGRYFQGGVVGFISGSTANFFVLGGQVMDIGKQWGWWWRIFLTRPRYPPTLTWNAVNWNCKLVAQVANWWRTLSPLYKAPNQFWVIDTNISGFVRCWDFQPSLTFSDFLWKILSYGPLKKTAPSQRGSFSRPTT